MVIHQGVIRSQRLNMHWHCCLLFQDILLKLIRAPSVLPAPGLACTAHSAQGKTKEAVIADLDLGRGVSGIASYVAITRIKNREGLMIYRPFDLAPFTEGIPEGTALLLRKLRGEELDWATIEEKIILKKACTVCKMKGDKSKFTRSEFRKAQETPLCLACMQIHGQYLL